MIDTAVQAIFPEGLTAKCTFVGSCVLQLDCQYCQYEYMYPW